MDAKSQLMAYLKGWSHGASRKAMHYPEQADYLIGYREGYDAYCKAATEAQAHYGAKLSVLRVQTVDDPCESCEWRQEAWRDGGWCYMFKERMEGCAQHKPFKQGA